MIKITLTRGLTAKRETQRRVVRALGLGKQGSSVIRHDSPTIRGMIDKVHHLVSVEPLSDVKVGDVRKTSKASGARPAAAGKDA